MHRKLVLASVALALLGALLAATWTIVDWPPPRLILKYGFPPTGGPTGRRRTVEGIELVELGPGYFRMGSHYLCEKGDLLGRICEPLGIPWGKHPKHGNECPTRWAEVRDPFWIARTEVTNDQLERYWYTRSNWSPDDDHPAFPISWLDARRFCNWLSKRADATVRLPTEIEWEYACRAGTTTPWAHLGGVDLLEYHGVYRHPEDPDPDVGHVASLCPNPWGLFDMHGNVWEWCEDYAEGGTSSIDRVARGGGFRDGPDSCRSASRFALSPRAKWNVVGFRPVAVFPEEE